MVHSTPINSSKNPRKRTAKRKGLIPRKRGSAVAKDARLVQTHVAHPSRRTSRPPQDEGVRGSRLILPSSATLLPREK